MNDARSMKRVVVIPGVGAGLEVIEAALPVLKFTSRGHVRWLLGRVSPVVDARPRIERALRDVVLRRQESGDIPEALARDFLNGEWPVFSAIKLALYRRALPEVVARELWDCVPVDLSRETRADLRTAAACLLGAVDRSTSKFLLWLRQGWDLYANVRPIFSHRDPAVNLVVVRENTEGMFSKIERRDKSGRAFALRVVTQEGTRRICRYAAHLARKRKQEGNQGRVTVVHKANVLEESDGLFLDVCAGVLDEENVPYDDMHVDACAIELIRNPQRFDVILTTNIFGDILSNVASWHMGGLGMAPSGGYGDRFAFFEPVHGSAPDLAGKGIANPMAAILSGAMLLEYLGLSEEASLLRRSVLSCAGAGKTTPDLGGRLTTREAADAVAQEYARTCGNILV